MTVGVYRFHLDYGRMGSLSGLFLEDSETVERNIGRRVYFGECLGKHSDVSFDLDNDQLQLVTDDSEIVKIFRNYNITSGWNPFEYIYDNDD